MSDICATCGLPKELCVCRELARETQKIKVSIAKRQFGKIVTIVSGFNPKEVDMKDIASKLKAKLACGGTFKGDAVELQGDHRRRIKQVLIGLGFDEKSIESS